MSLRTFTVFQDAPSTTPLNRHSANSTFSTVLSSKPLDTHQQQPTTIVSADKENLHPLTGERAGPSTNHTTNNTKKRKTSVLAAKVQPSLAVKKQKESNDTDTKKKRKPSTTTTKSKTGAKKDGKSTTRKVTKKPSRRASPLPKVDEELEVDTVKEGERMSQAEIDSRCYELTVQPLADLSQAYEQATTSTSTETPVIDEKIKFRSIKESSLEPEIRDYLSTSARLSSLSPGPEMTPATVEERPFSTPERKRIYAAFTFTSPSPTSERFSKANRTNEDSVPRLELV